MVILYRCQTLSRVFDHWRIHCLTKFLETIPSSIPISENCLCQQVLHGWIQKPISKRHFVVPHNNKLREWADEDDIDWLWLESPWSSSFPINEQSQNGSFCCFLQFLHILISCHPFVTVHLQRMGWIKGSQDKANWCHIHQSHRMELYITIWTE